MKKVFDSLFATFAPLREEVRVQKDAAMPAQAALDPEQALQPQPAEDGSARTLPRDARPAWFPAIDSDRTAEAPDAAPPIATAEAAPPDAALPDAMRPLPAAPQGHPAWAGSEIGTAAALLASTGKTASRSGRAAPGGGALPLRVSASGRRPLGLDGESEAIAGVTDRSWYQAMAAVDGQPRREAHPRATEPLPDGAGRHALGKCCRHQGTTAGESMDAVGMPEGYCLRMRRPCRFHRP